MKIINPQELARVIGHHRVAQRQGVSGYQ